MSIAASVLPPPAAPAAPTRNYAIDVFRYLGAVAVILLHVQYLGLRNEIVLLLRWLGRWAVPFFFLTSGYFFQQNYRKHGPNAALKSLLNLTTISLVVNLFFAFFKLAQTGLNWQRVFSLSIFTMNGHLWFLNALLIGYLLLLVLLERGAQRWLLLIANVMVVFSLATNAYANLLHIRADKSFAMLVLGLPFLIYGYKASETQFIQKHVTQLTAWIFITGGFLLQTLEILVLYKLSGYSPHNQEFLLGTLFFSFGIFALALTISVPRDTALANAGRTYSLPIYLYHPLVIALVTYLLTLLPAAYLPIALWLNPVLCVVLSLCLVHLLAKRAPRLFTFMTGG